MITYKSCAEKTKKIFQSLHDLKYQLIKEVNLLQIQRVPLFSVLTFLQARIEYIWYKRFGYLFCYVEAFHKTLKHLCNVYLSFNKVW